MHKIHAKEFELDDFSHEHLIVDDSDYGDVTWEEGMYTGELYLLSTISGLNFFRKKYIETKDKIWWWQMIQLLPSSYNQKRTVTFTYENVVTMIKQRSGHKLIEWEDFCTILKELPYIAEIIDG